MANPMIESMVKAVQQGRKPRNVWETSLTYAPGSTQKLNKDTSASLREGGTVSLKAGSTVTVVGIGGGSSGVDHHVQLPDGREAFIPFYDLGESVRESLADVVMKVTLNKPLPQSVIDWLRNGYYDWGVNMPERPAADSATSVTFYMKAAEQNVLDIAVEELKKLAGTSFKSADFAALTDFYKTL